MKPAKTITGRSDATPQTPRPAPSTPSTTTRTTGQPRFANSPRFRTLGHGGAATNRQRRSRPRRRRPREASDCREVRSSGGARRRAGACAAAGRSSPERDEPAEARSCAAATIGAFVVPVEVALCGMQRLGRWAVVLAMVTTLTGCGSGVIPAPATADLPIAAGGQVLASLVTVSGVIGTQDPRRFRSIAISALQMRGLQLLQAQIRTLLAHGWRHLRVTACCKTTASGGGAEVSWSPTSITNPQANVQLYSPNRRNYVSMSLLTDNPGDWYSHVSRRAHRALEQAYLRRQPILDVTFAALSS